MAELPRNNPTPQQRLEQYLKQATKGLYGKRRARVVRELRGNLLARANEFRAFGSSESQTLEKALDEFGAARAVSRGFYEVYTMPILNKWTAAAGLLGIAAFMSLSATASGVQYTLESPVPVCSLDSTGFKTRLCALEGSSWLEVDSLVKTLQDSGLKVRLELEDGISGPESKEKPIRFIQLYFPNQDRAATVRSLVSNGTSNDGSIFPTSFQSGDKLFMGTGDFIEALSNVKIRLRISSFVNPTLKFEGVTLKLGSESQPINIQAGLEKLLFSSLMNVPRAVPIGSDSKPFTIPEMNGPLEPFRNFIMVSSSVWTREHRGPIRSIHFTNRPEQFFLLMTRVKSTQPKAEPLVFLELLEKNKQGIGLSKSLPKNAHFVSNVRALYKGTAGDVLLIPVHFEKPYDLLDTKNPVVPSSSNISN